MGVLDDIRPVQLAINRREKLLMKVVVERYKKQARWKKMGLRLTKKGVPDKRYCPHARTKVVTPICFGRDEQECCECGKVM